MLQRKRTAINLICSLAVMVTNLIIGFFLSPYIVKNIGVEANGFVTLANSFVSYANIIVTSLNSMAARFITIAYVNKDYKKANTYYNSVFWGNLIIVAVLILPAVYFIVQMQNLINIPNNIVNDVKLLFSFVMFNFFITTGLPNWDCGTYVSNRLDRKYIPNMITSVFRCIFLFMIFYIWNPHVWYVGFSTTIVKLAVLAISWYNTHKLTPELKVKLKPKEIICSKKAIKDLVGSGIWNSISDAGVTLLGSLDLIICNLAISDSSMGILSLSKSLSGNISTLSSSILNVFAPQLTINYAMDDKDELYKNINSSMKLTSVIITIPVCIIIIIGDFFFSLWVPSQDAILLHRLTILATFSYIFTSGTQILYNVFPTVNKVKPASIALLINGVISTIITLIAIKYTNYGIYAVAGVSTACTLIRNMTFTLPVSAKYIGLKWYCFFPQVIKSSLTSFLLIGIGYIIKPILPSSNWIGFIVSSCILGIIGLTINMFIILDKHERLLFINVIKSKLHFIGK